MFLRTDQSICREFVEGINCRITNIESLVKDFGSSSEDKRTLAQYIIGENDAFDALTEAVKKSNISVKTTRFSPYSVVGRQNVFLVLLII